mgnify:CR=1 FL=1
MFFKRFLGLLHKLIFLLFLKGSKIILEIPVKFISMPIIENTKWKVEINSKYLCMLDKYEVYDKLLIHDDSTKISFKFIDGKNYLFYNNIPKLDNNFIYVRKVV